MLNYQSFRPRYKMVQLISYEVQYNSLVMKYSTIRWLLQFIGELVQYNKIHWLRTTVQFNSLVM